MYDDPVPSSDMAVAISPPEESVSASLSSRTRETGLNGYFSSSPSDFDSRPSSQKTSSLSHGRHPPSDSLAGGEIDASSSPLFQKILQSRLSSEGGLRNQQKSNSTAPSQNGSFHPQLFHPVAVHGASPPSYPSEKKNKKDSRGEESPSGILVTTSPYEREEQSHDSGRDVQYEQASKEEKRTSKACGLSVEESRVGGGSNEAREPSREEGRRQQAFNSRSRNRGSSTQTGDKRSSEAGEKECPSSSPLHRPIEVHVPRKSGEDHGVSSSLRGGGGQAEEWRDGDRGDEGEARDGQKVVRLKDGELISLGKDRRREAEEEGFSLREDIDDDDEDEDEDDLPLTWKGRLKKKWMSMPWFKDLHAEVSNKGRCPASKRRRGTTSQRRMDRRFHLYI